MLPTSPVRVVNSSTSSAHFNLSLSLERRVYFFFIPFLHFIKCMDGSKRERGEFKIFFFHSGWLAHRSLKIEYKIYMLKYTEWTFNVDISAKCSSIYIHDREIENYGNFASAKKFRLYEYEDCYCVVGDMWWCLNNVYVGRQIVVETYFMIMISLDTFSTH